MTEIYGEESEESVESRGQYVTESVHLLVFSTFPQPPLVNWPGC